MEPHSFQTDSVREFEAAVPTIFRWDVPGRAATILIDFDLVDRLGFEIMRGFGAIPKRGAEVGGILLGSAEVGDRLVIRVEDFVAVPCEHQRGPSYILSDRDVVAFDEALERWRPAPDKRIYVVGYYRSNTRESLQLSPEDQELLETRFPGSSAICLQVKPYATRAGDATFFLRENGHFPTSVQPGAFPFRRKELGGGRPPRRPRATDMPGPEPEPESAPRFGAASLMPELSTPTPVPAPTPSSTGASTRPGWFWIPLSFIFLLLGVVLGFQVALTYRGQQQSSQAADPYTLDLTVVQFGESLHLKWNSDAAAFRNAKRGVLHIRDGDNSKEVELKQEDLSRGGALYRNATTSVKFRLEIFPRDRNSVAESIELRLLGTRK